MIEVFAVIGLVIGFAGYIVLTSVVKGWVLSIMWQWFVMPIFDLRAISIIEAIGICMIVSYLTYQYQKANDDRSAKEQSGDLLYYGIVHPLVVLGIGSIVHLFL